MSESNRLMKRFFHYLRIIALMGLLIWSGILGVGFLEYQVEASRCRAAGMDLTVEELYASWREEAGFDSNIVPGPGDLIKNNPLLPTIRPILFDYSAIARGASSWDDKTKAELVEIGREGRKHIEQIFLKIGRDGLDIEAVEGPYVLDFATWEFLNDFGWMMETINAVIAGNILAGENDKVIEYFQGGFGILDLLIEVPHGAIYSRTLAYHMRLALLVPFWLSESSPDSAQIERMKFILRLAGERIHPQNSMRGALVEGLECVRRGVIGPGDDYRANEVLPGAVLFIGDAYSVSAEYIREMNTIRLVCASDGLESAMRYSIGLKDKFSSDVLEREIYSNFKALANSLYSTEWAKVRLYSACELLEMALNIERGRDDRILHRQDEIYHNYEFRRVTENFGYMVEAVRKSEEILDLLGREKWLGEPRVMRVRNR